MILPTVHLNGTSRDALVGQYNDAAEAVYQAIRAMEQLDVNGRDYYPQGPTALSSAVREHRARIDLLCQVRRDLLAIADACDAA